MVTDADVTRAYFKETGGADVGVGLALSLPLSAQSQIQSGQPWDVTTGPSAAPGSWGRKQQMSWA